MSKFKNLLLVAVVFLTVTFQLKATEIPGELFYSCHDQINFLMVYKKRVYTFNAKKGRGSVFEVLKTFSDSQQPNYIRFRLKGWELVVNSAAPQGSWYFLPQKNNPKKMSIHNMSCSQQAFDLDIIEKSVEKYQK